MGKKATMGQINFEIKEHAKMLVSAKKQSVFDQSRKTLKKEESPR